MYLGNISSPAVFSVGKRCLAATDVNPIQLWQPVGLLSLWLSRPARRDSASLDFPCLSPRDEASKGHDRLRRHPRERAARLTSAWMRC